MRSVSGRTIDDGCADLLLVRVDRADGVRSAAESLARHEGTDAALEFALLRGAHGQQRSPRRRQALPAGREPADIAARREPGRDAVPAVRADLGRRPVNALDSFLTGGIAIASFVAVL